MKKKDFVDDDLIQRIEDRHADLAASKDVAGSRMVEEEGYVPVRAISGASLGHMAKHKADVNDGMVKAINEMEQLRRRQQELEEEKGRLEELGQKQSEYERGKREIIDRINEGIIALEKKEIQTSQLSELLVSSRNRFKTILEEIEALNEDQWRDERFRNELYKALVIIDDARMEYNKALAKIDVLEGTGESMLERRPIVIDRAGQERVAQMGFGSWIKVGFAVTLPFMILLLAVLAVYYVLLLHFLI